MKQRSIDFLALKFFMYRIMTDGALSFSDSAQNQCGFGGTWNDIGSLSGFYQFGLGPLSFKVLLFSRVMDYRPKTDRDYQNSEYADSYNQLNTETGRIRGVPFRCLPLLFSSHLFGYY
jgi:hypothetical protein